MPAAKTIGAFITGCAGLSLSAAEREFLHERNPWGLILFKRNCESPEQVKALTTAFRESVGRRDAPIFIDQEGGRVQRLAPPCDAWRKYPPARSYGELYKRDALAALRSARHVGRLMAEDLTAIGINANCVPVLDVPQIDGHQIIGDRAYSGDSQSIMVLARAHAAGFMDGGVLPVIKHIPGHGRATADSHHDLPIVDATADELRAIDFPPFASFADAPMAMTAHVIFTAFDKKNPATLSAGVIKKVIRREIGFSGLLMSDDLSMKALSGSLAERTERALAAGCDIVLHCNGVMEEMEQVAKAASSLKGKARSRARIALKSARKPQLFDRKAALKDLEALVSG